VRPTAGVFIFIIGALREKNGGNETEREREREREIFRADYAFSFLAAEHPVERQSLVNFVTNTIQGIIPSVGNVLRTSHFGPIDPDFWEVTGMAAIPTTVFAMWPVRQPEVSPIRRLFHSLGSNAIPNVFTVATAAFNGAKGRVCAHSFRPLQVLSEDHAPHRCRSCQLTLHRCGVTVTPLTETICAL
jgi:hypothetical protein